MTHREGAAGEIPVAPHAYIVGRGPSLAHLRAEHIGPGLVLTLNGAIPAVDALMLPNVVVSLQNDGDTFPTRALRITNRVCEVAGLSWDAVALGMEAPDAMVIRVATAIAKSCCSKITYLCCDALASGDPLKWTPDGTVDEQDLNVLHVLPFLLTDLEGWDYDVVTPEPTATAAVTAEVSAVVTRADGTVIDLGVISTTTTRECADGDR